MQVMWLKSYLAKMLDNVGIMKKPNDGFILIVDSDGDIIEFYTKNAVLDEVLYMVDKLDRISSDYAPHSAWQFIDNQFILIQDIMRMQ
jgi:hypothetical protein